MAQNKNIAAPLPYSIKDISFHTIDSTFLVKQKTALREWIALCIKKERFVLGEVSINIVSDAFLLKMNRKHLKHDFYTDIITFDYSENKTVSGDLFISIDRVKENAKIESKTIYNELCRVIIHGILHLCKYKDKKPEDARQMRLKEDKCLSLLTQ
jgi:probable rRNA maturation factor